MKVKNIVFSGFAAAILMGTANVSAVTFNIASRDYVDNLVGTNGTITQTVSDLNEQINGDPTDNTDNGLAGAVSDLNEQINGDPTDDTDNGLAGDVAALEDALGDGFSENNTVADALALKQNESDSNVATNGNYISAGHGVAANLTALDGRLKTTTDTANAATVREINTNDGKALIFNESDGGGAKFENSDGTWSFTGVNNGGANGIAAQIYAVDGTSRTGSRINVTKGGIYYTSGKSNATYASTDEIATKGDITTALNSAVGGSVGDLTQLSDDFTSGETDSVVEALNDLQSTKADAADVYTKTEVNSLMEGKLGVPADDCSSTIEPGESAYCALVINSQTGGLAWAKITATFDIQ